MVTLRYFASIRETLGVDHEQVALPADGTVAGLIAVIAQRHGARWQQVAGSARVLAAVNHDVAPYEAAVRDGDEVAFFPPVTGG